jgi:hypothetical protein
MHLQTFENVHEKEVTCFLYPFEMNNRYDPTILLSGGIDFAVVGKLIIS